MSVTAPAAIRRATAPRSAYAWAKSRRAHRASPTHGFLPTLRHIARTLAFARGSGHGAAMHDNLVQLARNCDDSVRHDWTRGEIRALFRLPFPDLMFQAQSVHRRNFDPSSVQISTLISIKTGGC